jgi:tetratricopeptide (TPR) repeat protein
MGAPGAGWGAPAQEDEELEQLLAEFRAEVELLMRDGEWGEARDELEGLLDEDPSDWRSRALLGRLEWLSGRYERARSELGRVRAALVAGTPEARLCLQTELELRAELADGAEWRELLERVEGAGFSIEDEPALAWPAAQLLLQLGQRDRALELLQAAVDADGSDWRDLLASGRAARWLGDLELASRRVVSAALAGRDDEPEVLAELASIYFEAEGEGQRRMTRGEAPGPLYREALGRDPNNETALLGLHELGQVNWRRQRRAASEYLGDLLRVRPDSVRGLLALGRAELELGRLPQVRAALERLERLAPGRREVRTLRSTLAWVEHDEDSALSMLERLVEEDPADSSPEREVGAALLDLYRFGEGLGFLRRAVERDPGDFRAWTQLGRALANTADVRGGLEALDRAHELAAGRHDVWRENTRLVLERIERDFVEREAGSLTFAWNPQGAEVLETYLVPFYAEARRELSLRYGQAVDSVRIEVFERHDDFSVRSTGFQGFPALGVCFGPVVTAVSPLSELRGSFSWARTSYHEFTHVIHLAISHNRCPRWITEGLATWEEERVNPAWGRNMRRDLLDARANGEIFPLRELNAAFRGPRIIFGYYQGGLLCEMLVRDHGFPSMIRLLEAFDRGLDLDAACSEVFGATPEQIDERFARFVDEQLAPLALEPRHDPERVAALRYTLATSPPGSPQAAEQWREDWCTVAWAAQQQGNRVDAEDALRIAESGGARPLRALALRGHQAWAVGDREAAVQRWREFLDAGGEDFFVRMAMAEHALEGLDDPGLCEQHLRAAEAAFPGFPESQASAELALARLFDLRGDTAAAMAARMRWLEYNADAGELRIEVARWLVGEERFEEAERYFREANDVDPFRASLHRDWARVLERLGRPAEALREVRVALAVPSELDADGPAALDAAAREELESARARLEREIDRGE